MSEVKTEIDISEETAESRGTLMTSQVKTEIDIAESHDPLVTSEVKTEIAEETCESHNIQLSHVAH